VNSPRMSIEHVAQTLPRMLPEGILGVYRPSTNYCARGSTSPHSNPDQGVKSKKRTSRDPNISYPRNNLLD